MRRLGYLVFLFATLWLGLTTVYAQSSTSIADYIREQSDADREYTILAQFLDTARTMDTSLSNSGSYTLLAPTDDAFRNLERALDIDLVDLISDFEIATAIVQYHTINRSLNTNQLRARDGQVLPTLLPNAFVGITRDTANNGIVVNNVVEVQPPPINTGNGTIHQLNDVLLNRVITDLLATQFEPEPTTTPTATPTNTPQPTATPATLQRSTANVRVAHLVADAPPLDVTIADTLNMTDLSYGALTDYVAVTQGIYTAQITSEDDPDLALSVDLTLLNGDYVTIAIIPDEDDDTLRVIVTTDDLSRLDTDEARVVVLNALPDAPPLSVIIDDDALIDDVIFGDVDESNLDAATATITITETRNSDVVLATFEAQSFVGEGLYWLIIYGDSSDPETILSETTRQDRINLEAAGTPTPVASNATATPTVPAGTVLDVIRASDEFSYMREAIAVVGPSAERALNSSDGVTLLAPSDQAFINLLSTVGYTRQRLFTDDDLVRDILEYHIIEAQFTTEDLANASGTSIITLLEPAQAFFVRATDSGRIFLNGTVEFERTDIQASNGVIHVVDDVLLPANVLEVLGL